MLFISFTDDIVFIDTEIATVAIATESTRGKKLKLYYEMLNVEIIKTE